MAAAKRLRQVAGEFNLGISTIVEFLDKKGIEIDSSPNTKLSPEAYNMLASEFAASKSEKQASADLAKERKSRKNVTIEASISTSDESELAVEVKTKVEERTATKVDTEVPAPVKEPEAPKEEKPESGLKVLGKIELDHKAEPQKKQAEKKEKVFKAVKKEVATESKDNKSTAKKDLVDTPKDSSAPDAAAKTIKDVEEVTPEKVDVPKKEETDIKDIPSKEPIAKQPVSKEAPAAEASSEQDAKKGPKVLGMLDNKMLNATNRPKKSNKNAAKKEAKSKVKNVVSKQEVKPEKQKEVVLPTPEAETPKENTDDQVNFVKTKVETLSGPKVLGKMVLPPEKKNVKKKPVGSSSDSKTSKRRRKRKRIPNDKAVPKVQQKNNGPKSNSRNSSNTHQGSKSRTRKKKVVAKPEITDEDIQKQIKETLARLSNKKKSTSVKHRRQKRDKVSAEHKEELERLQLEQKVLKVTEFVSANDLANMMGVNVNEIIATCMNLGLFVSINQRLDAETLVIVAEEFGYEVKFVDAEGLNEDAEQEEEDLIPDTHPRTPIVTVMGHVDHGKTSLLDYIRSANVIAGEAGGITQHIGAYEVELEDNKKITFLDTPGHEAFTAMRARGSKVTDIAVIVVAADDAIMPQTKEAINHAQAAEVPIIFAINKIDKPGANPEKIKEQLAAMNLLVEDWGGKIQSQDISAKHGTNIDELMEKILLEAEMLELKCNPERRSYGTVLESFLDKGKGYVANILVQNGTLRIGDIILAGTTWGKVKAMYNERNKRINEVGPAQPALILGLNSAPIAGDAFKGLKDEHEAKNIANKRERLQREQSVHAKKHITLDEIGRRLAIGDFQELNIIVKGDVDGSVEALSDSLEKLTNEEIQVNIIHKSVGQINEADVILASASDAIIVGFQVRPSLAARKLAEKEGTDIRLYSVIYKAIDEIKMAIQGMLAPTIVEEIVCNIEVRETFKITKVGTIAGCYVLDGKIKRNDNIRVIRDGIVIYTGLLGSLKRFKDDAKEVSKGFECGLNIEKFNDIKVGDIIEGFTEVEVERTV